MTVTDDYLANNAEYASSFNGPLPLPPSKHVAVVACMDARLDVYRILGLNEGEAHVIRNAGGVVTDDAIRSLAISQRLLGNPGDHPDPPHRLRDADVYRRRLQARHPGRDRESNRRGRPRLSPISRQTSASRCAASRTARSSPSTYRCAASSSTSQPASSTRSRCSALRRADAKAPNSCRFWGLLRLLALSVVSRSCRWRGPWRAACPPDRRSRPHS